MVFFVFSATSTLVHVFLCYPQFPSAGFLPMSSLFSMWVVHYSCLYPLSVWYHAQIIQTYVSPQRVSHVPLAPSALCLLSGCWLYLLGLYSIKMSIFGTAAQNTWGPKVSCPKSKLYVTYAFDILLCIYKDFNFFFIFF